MILTYERKVIAKEINRNRVTCFICLCKIGFFQAMLMAFLSCDLK